jgi:hypothetical protein
MRQKAAHDGAPLKMKIEDDFEGRDLLYFR